MRRPTRLRDNLFRDLAILVLGLGLAIFAATAVGGRQAVGRLSAALVGQSLDTVEARLDAFFAAARQDMGLLSRQAADGAFDLAADASPAAQRAHRDRLLMPLVETSSQISSIILTDGGGREHMLLRTQDGWRTRVSGAGAPGMVRWFERAAGEPAVEREEASTYDPRTRPWYTQAIDAEPGDLHWTAPYAFFTTGEPGITVSARFDDGSGVARIVGLDLRLADVSEFTRSLTVGERGIVALITEDGEFIGLPGLPEFDDPATRAEAWFTPPGEMGIRLIDDAIAAHGPAPEDGADGRSTVRFRSGGEPWWSRTAPYQLGPDRTIVVAILVPEADLLDGIDLTRNLIIASVGIVLLAGMLRVIVVARRVSEPIEAIVARQSRITRGDLTESEPVRSPIREISRLAAAQEHLREGIVARLRLEKVERDLDLAREIQRGLLPAVAPEIPGFDIAGWNLPADETGGDFFDWAPLPDGEISFTLADVTGHGIGPALIVSEYRAYLRAATTGVDADLGAVLSHVNRLLHADIPDGRFVTAAIGVLSPAASRLELLSAGHGPVLYLDAKSDTVHEWKADTVPLGIVPEIDTETPRVVDMAPGDMLLLVTDGFFEWTNDASEQYGVERLVAFMRTHRGLDAAAFIAALHEDVLAHAAGTPQADDLTAFVVRRVGPA